MKKINVDKIMKLLSKEFKQNEMPIIDLIKSQTDDEYKILVGTILSARTKDETTAKVSNALFAKAPSMLKLNKLTLKEIETLIRPINYYKNKAKYLKKLPEVLKTEFQGKIPSEIDDLIKLPGVGRKTANLVRGTAFGKPAICVDTHVHRISNRLGYVKTKTPLETEMALRKKLPEKYWIDYNKFLVSFGQNTCKPINPKCNKCPINQYCNRIGVSNHS
ncbi:MAG: endonuclease III [Candidatus Woesearchaeota archaeon]